MLNAPTDLQCRLIRCYLGLKADRSLVNDLVRDELPMPTLRLLSAALRGIQEQHPGLRELDKLQGQLRYFWVVQQLQQQALGVLMSHFGTHGIPTLVIGGTALSMNAYPRASMRSCGEIDLLVSSQFADQVNKALDELGWVANSPVQPELQPIQLLTRYSKGVGVHLNVHWRLYPDQNPASLDAIFSRSTAFATPDGSQLRSLEAHDHLLWLMVDGRSGCDEGPRAQWILDCLVLLKCKTIQWPRVVQYSLLEGVSVQFQDALSILYLRFGVTVGPDCLEPLKSQPLFGRLDSLAQAQPPSRRQMWSRAWLLWRDYRRLNLSHKLGLIDFLKLRWKQPGSTGLISSVWARLRNRTQV